MEPFAFLGPAWCAAVTALGPVPDSAWGGPPVSLRLEVTGGPDGDVRIDATLRASEAVVVAVAESTRPADVVVTVVRPVAVDVAAGSLRLDTAYMQGRLKVAGPHRLVLALLAATATPAWEQARDRLAAMTDFGSA